MEGKGSVGILWHGAERSGQEWRGKVRKGFYGMVWIGMTGSERQGRVWKGKDFRVRSGRDWSGPVVRGLVRKGVER